MANDDKSIETKNEPPKVEQVKQPEERSAETSVSAPEKTKEAVAEPTPSAPAQPEPVKPQGSKLRRLVPVAILLIAAAILFFIAADWNSIVGREGHQKTDDAYLRADITPLSTRVSGTVMLVAVEDYQKVKAGDLLVQIKDDDYRAQVEQAEAAVQAANAAMENNSRQKSLQESRIAQAEAGVEAAKADIAQAEANIEATKADIANAKAGVDATTADATRTQLEKRRQEALVESASATRQKLEQVTADEERFGAQLKSRDADLAKTQSLLDLRRAQAQQARAGLASRQAELEAQRRQRGVLDAQEAQLRADLRAKEESVKIARTNLEYTRIVAPTDGTVGERRVRIGQLVSPGTQVLSLVEPSVWVQANYKETQLTNVRKGDSASVSVDTFPGHSLKGHVVEISPASGSQFALLPPDNASGNFTKIVQRIPVKIVLDKDPGVSDHLRPGMSVIVEINASGKNSDGTSARK